MVFIDRHQYIGDGFCHVVLTRYAIFMCCSPPAHGAEEHPVHVRRHELRHHGEGPLHSLQSAGPRHQREEAGAVRPAGGAHQKNI